MSNCIIEALKQKVLHPTRVKIYKRGKLADIFKGKCPHFYWYDKKKMCFMHFCERKEGEPFVKQLLFDGDIREFYHHRKV